MVKLNLIQEVEQIKINVLPHAIVQGITTVLELIADLSFS